MNLYVSDLDGTLLNSEKKLSDFTVKTINTMIEEGLNFTIATARSFSSAEELIEPLDLKLPIVLNNGGFIYDPLKEKFIKESFLENDISNIIIDILTKNDINPLVHLIEDGTNKMFYKGLSNYGEKHYYNDRIEAGDQRFTLVDDYNLDDKKVITIFAIDELEKLQQAKDVIENKFNIQIHLFKDVYSNFYWLEINHYDANKKSGINYLKELLDAKKVIGFGDNLNDLSMFEICDEKYAVENAHEDLKEDVNRIIESNNDDGVAKFLKNL